MASIPHSMTNPTTESPANSETAETKESVPAADVSTTESKIGMTSNQSEETTKKQPMSAEEAADKLYEERIEDEYAKREDITAHSTPELPSSPPTPKHVTVSIASASSPPTPRGRDFLREEDLLSPEIARRLPPPRTPASASSRYRSNSSEYYTAAWGSPYEQSSSPTGSVRTALSEQLPSEEQLGSSPLQNYGLEDLVTSRIAPRPTLAALGRSATGDDGLYTPRSRTQRWVQVPQRGPSERSSWWSDDAPSASDEGTRHTRGSSSVSVQVVERQLIRSHRKREDNLTLNQQSFLRTLRDGEQGDMASISAPQWADTPPPEEQDGDRREDGNDDLEVQHREVDAEGGTEEKRALEDTQSVSDAAKGAPGDSVLQVAETMESRHKSSHASLTPLTRRESSRPRKKVVWRGKTCVISMSNVDRQAMGMENPMSANEVQERLRQFEDAGYNIRGFDLGQAAYDSEGTVHVKPIYPDEADLRLQANERRAKVTLPDLNKWKAYTDGLLEQKLAALGVSTGLLSPPIPTNSAGSSGRPGVLRGHSRTSSVASPLSPGFGPGHMHRHSTFAGRPGVAQLQTQPQLPPFPGMQALSPGERNAMSSFLARGGSSKSPQDHSRGFANDQQQRQHAYSQSMQQSAFVPQMASISQTPVLPDLQEVVDEEEHQNSAMDSTAYMSPQKRAQINADVAIPTPTRGHRHNPSQGLERDVLEAEQRQEDERSKWIKALEDDHYHPRQNGASPSAEMERNCADRAFANNAIQPQTAARGHKKAPSQFNASAPSFSFNPRAPVQPASPAFTFGGRPTKGNGGGSNGHTREASSYGALNVAAPAFQPAESSFHFSAQAPQPKLNTSTSVPSSDARTVVDDLPSIFGKVNIPDVVKPSKKSKAIAIIRPDENKGSDEEFEDDEGRVAQSDDRLKRQQRSRGGDGDEVPRFAEPTPTPEPIAFAPTKTGNIDESVAETAEADRSALHHANIDDTRERESGESAVPDSMHRHKPSSSLSAFASPFEPATLRQASKDEVSDRLMRINSQVSAPENDELQQDELSDVSAVHLSEGSEGSSRALPRQESPFDYEASERINQVTQLEPSFDEIDAVMRQLNAGEFGDEAPAGELNDRAYSPLPDLSDQPMLGVTYLPAWGRSAGPSPSPTRGQGIQYANGDSSLTVHDRTDSGEAANHDWSQVHRLNKTEDVPLSDWSGMLSPPGEEKLQARSNYFDSHIEELLGRVIERRLRPLEERLMDTRSTANKRTRSSDRLSLKRSSSNVESDADDEDDLSDAPRHRPQSRGRDKRTDEIKAAVLEALHEQGSRKSQSSYDIADLHSALADMKVSFARAASASLELDDIRLVVEDVLSRQDQSLAPRSIGGHKDSHSRGRSGHEGRLKETLDLEEREAESRRLLRLAEEELTLLRDSVRDDNGRLHILGGERHELLERAARAEEAQHNAEEQVKSLEAENDAMQGTLDEYRLSSSKWRVDIDDAKQEREELKKTITALERQVDEGQESSTSMRRRLEKLHADMAFAAGQLVSEKAAWRRAEEDLLHRCETLESQQEMQKKERYDLEEELRVARIGNAEAFEAKLALDHVRASNLRLDGVVSKLRSDFVEQQSLAARFEQELHDAKDLGTAEVLRIRVAYESELDAAKNQVNLMRTDYDSELRKVRMELGEAKTNAETAQTRYERLLQEETIARSEAARENKQASSAAQEEAQSKHDAALRELSAQHARAIRHEAEDKQHLQYILSEKLELSAAKLEHAQDRIMHLEERLVVAKAAAQAAVESVHAKAGTNTHPPSSGLPEKVSPQALRESILVLQEQLQEREASIERLQTQVDKDHPAKLKERDTEITWLRELLAVRNDDLGDLINTLSSSDFDRESVRDVAIRIRCNLQMEEQEKGRYSSNPQSTGGKTLANLSSFATPKAASLSSAFNKWRTTMESSSLRHAPSSAGIVRSSTPSRMRPSASSSSFPAGLLTPPASSIRSTLAPEATMSILAPRPQSHDDIKTTRTPSPSSSRIRSRQVSGSPGTPTTPLLRDQSYDHDADDSEVPLQIFEDDDLDVADSEPPAFHPPDIELDASLAMETAL